MHLDFQVKKIVLVRVKNKQSCFNLNLSTVHSFIGLSIFEIHLTGT